MPNQNLDEKENDTSPGLSEVEQLRAELEVANSVIMAQRQEIYTLRGLGLILILNHDSYFLFNRFDAFRKCRSGTNG